MVKQMSPGREEWPTLLSTSVLFYFIMSGINSLLICGVKDIFKHFHGTSQEKIGWNKAALLFLEGKKGVDEMCVFMLRKHLWNKALRHIKQQGHMVLKAQTYCSRGDLGMLLVPQCTLEAGALVSVHFKSNSGSGALLSQETFVRE